MTQTITDLQTAVNAEDTVIASAITLITGLSTQIAQLKTAGTDPATAAAIDALVTDVNNQSSTLAASVAQNTPAQTPPSPQPVTS